MTTNIGTLVAVLQTAQGIGPATLDPIQPTDYVKTGTVGTLTLHNKGHLPWTPGHYIVALRGGPNGVKTTGGQGIVAAPVFFLIAQGQPLNTEAALSLLYGSQFPAPPSALPGARFIFRLPIRYTWEPEGTKKNNICRPALTS